MYGMYVHVYAQLSPLTYFLHRDIFLLSYNNINEVTMNKTSKPNSNFDDDDEPLPIKRKKIDGEDQELSHYGDEKEEINLARDYEYEMDFQVMLLEENILTVAESNTMIASVESYRRLKLSPKQLLDRNLSGEWGGEDWELEGEEWKE